MAISELKNILSDRNSIALIMSEENVRYFTSFTSTNGYLLVSSQTSIYLTDSRYIEAAQNQCVDCDEIILFENFEKSVVPIINKLNIKQIEIEGSRTTVSRLNLLRKYLPDCEFISDKLDNDIDSLRSIKNKIEADKIQKAQIISENALDKILPLIKVGAREIDIALELDYTMLRMGAQALSFETIAVSGKKSSMPHGVPSEKKIENGDFITLDFGAVYDGYHSDMTRTFAVGSVSDKMVDVYNTVLKAQSAGLDAVKPGKICKDVDAVARNIITDKGYGKYFGHSLGHGVGIEIHEFPNLSPKSDTILKVGNVVTVEPGIYIPGEFGVRIEDMVIITENGCHNFTSYKKELEIL